MEWVSVDEEALPVVVVSHEVREGVVLHEEELGAVDSEVLDEERDLLLTQLLPLGFTAWTGASHKHIKTLTQSVSSTRATCPVDLLHALQHSSGA